VTSRQTLTEVANDPASVLGKGGFGSTWAAKILQDGTQVWVQIRNGRITNGGVNARPRVFELCTRSSAASSSGVTSYFHPAKPFVRWLNSSSHITLGEAEQAIWLRC